jgi:hypothetical protein
VSGHHAQNQKADLLREQRHIDPAEMEWGTEVLHHLPLRISALEFALQVSNSLQQRRLVCQAQHAVRMKSLGKLRGRASGELVGACHLLCGIACRKMRRLGEEHCGDGGKKEIAVVEGALELVAVEASPSGLPARVELV